VGQGAGCFTELHGYFSHLSLSGGHGHLQIATQILRHRRVAWRATRGLRKSRELFSIVAEDLLFLVPMRHDAIPGN